MKNITINITSKCNAQCKHCCFSCSPNNKEELNDKEIWEIINYAISNNEINEIAITGGEPFLREDLVYKIIKRVSDNNKVVTCISNGFWATTYENARNKLKKLSNLGLTRLTISYDEFHVEYIPVKNIKNILEASIQLPLKVSMNISVTKEKTSNALLDELQDYLLGVPITRFSVAPVGAAKMLNDNFYYKLDIDKPLKCSEPASGMVIHHDGYVYPCCSPLIFDTSLRIGSIRDYTLNDLNKKFHSNLLLYVVKKEGLNWFVRKCKEKGYNKFRKKYISSCQLCHELFKDYKIMNLLYDDLKEYYMNEISKI